MANDGVAEWGIHSISNIKNVQESLESDWHTLSDLRVKGGTNVEA